MSRYVVFGLALLLLLGTASHVSFAKEPEAVPLPIRRVVVFTSGVAFVEHRGEVDGDQTIDLRFHVDDVNDLLKSMVVQDEGGGKIEMVTYAPQESTTVQLGNLRVDPSQVRSLGDLLAQLRGEKVELELVPNKVTGTIVAVDRRRVHVGEKETVEQETLLLKTEAGLRNVSLASIAMVKLSDPALDRDLQKALEVIATANLNEKKLVSLRLRGAGKRQVRVGYIQEFPVWKTAYRLVLDEKKPPLLQGWAIVENTSDHDWKDVQVSLVSGRPVSFTMDLYEPMFLARPRVVPEMFAGLQPKLHDQDLAAGEEAFRKLAEGKQGFAGGGIGGQGGFGGGLGGFGGGGGGRSQRPFVTSVAPIIGIDPRSSLQAMAQGTQVGTLFRYAVETPVSLASQKSAMLPIVNEEIAVARKAIFNAATHEKHPMSAVELHNKSKLHWMQGPLTLFEAGEYAGDAQMSDIPPDAKRLVTYALDLNIEATSEPAKVENEAQIDVKIASGRVVATVTNRRTREYTIKNSRKEPVEVLVEQPIDAAWKLTKDIKPTEETRDVYRFAVNAKPGEPMKIKSSEFQLESRLGKFLTDADGPENGADPFTKADDDPFGAAPAVKPNRSASELKTVDAFTLACSATKPSAELRAAVEQWQKLRAAIGTIEAEKHRVGNQSAAIRNEQPRVRENIAAVPKDGDLYKRYLTTLAKQEDQLEKLDAELAKIDAEHTKRVAALEDFLRKLKVD